MSRILMRVAVIASAVLVTLVGADTTRGACNGANEIGPVYYQSCPAQTCRALVAGMMCTQVHREPLYGCRCKPGFYRNVVNACVSEEECRNCYRPHEYPSCGSACDNECATIGVQNSTNCPIVNIVCNKKCYCEDGFSRDCKGNCIPNSQC